MIMESKGGFLLEFKNPSLTTKVVLFSFSKSRFFSLFVSLRSGYRFTFVGRLDGLTAKVTHNQTGCACQPVENVSRLQLQQEETTA